MRLYVLSLNLTDGLNLIMFFLQHGITKDKAKWLYSNVCCFKYFITAAIPEYNFINKYYGYSDNTVKLTGFPRYDNLFNFKVNKKQILIMPTWRYWFNLSSKQSDDTDNDFYSSEYLAKWSSLLKNKNYCNIFVRMILR